MKRYLYAFVASACMSFIVACGNTTKDPEEISNSPASDSAVGNSAAANTIYRDSSDVSHATESGGGTGNPANTDSVR